MADLFISNGNHISNLYKNSFWYNGEILVSGSPRNDIIFDNSDSLNRKIRTFFKINDDTKIALYAPTFRKSNDLEVYNLDYERCISALKRRFSGEWVILLRLHPNISGRAKNIQYTKNVLNATKYDDMQELLAISDVLITDYSSSMFDFTLKLRPCFLYIPDVVEYMKDRNFYFSLDELPFPIGEDNNEFVAEILDFDEKRYEKELTNFFEKQGIVEDGSASKRVVERIKTVIKDIKL